MIALSKLFIDQVMKAQILLVALILALSPFISYSQTDLFDDTTALKLTILSDWDSLLHDRGDSVSLHKARLNYQKDGERKSIRAKIRSRGNFRKNPAVCTFPPIKVYIDKEYRKGTLFAKHKALKLVCHCREESAILQEYLLYKVYQMLTPYSFSVRLAEITYVDLKGTRPPEKHYGFFIEDDKRVAKRMGGKRFDDPITRLDSIDKDQLHLVHAFMYMSGNMDWNVLMRKNVKLITPQKGQLPLPVPYDFDWSGVVNASYTGIDQTFERRDMHGLCLSMEEWKNLSAKFLAIEDEVKDLYKGFYRLDLEERTRAIQYYKYFFKIISKESKIQQRLIDPCGSEGE
ncbi:MAG: hypothetical protein MRZ79_16070 [Bacteroidia bacterium]|nr:hypothetical protein [Bacteroidia bacterium]